MAKRSSGWAQVTCASVDVQTHVGMVVHSIDGINLVEGAETHYFINVCFQWQ